MGKDIIMLLNKKVLFGLLLAGGISSQAIAGWNIGGVYSHFDIGAYGLDGVALSVGYEFRQDDRKLSFMPVLQLGVGVGDDPLEIKAYYGLSSRVNYYASPSFYVFIQPAYTNVELKVSAMGKSVTANDWEYGYGGGIGFTPTDDLILEVMFEKYDDTDVLSAGIRYRL
jgi:hypothetical protein